MIGKPQFLNYFVVFYKFYVKVTVLYFLFN